MSSRPIPYTERALPRDLGALLLSTLLHLLPVLLGLIPALAFRLMPKSPIQIEILPPKPRPKLAVAELPQPKPPSEAATPRPQPKGPGPGQSGKQGPPAPSVQRVDLAKGKLAGLGPQSIDQDIGVRVLLRMPALRQSPHRAIVEALLHAFPDTHILAAGTKYATPFSPRVNPPPGAPPPPPPTGLMARALIDDLDALLIETADPQNISSTVFYAVPRTGTELPQRLAERRSPRWDTRALHTLNAELLAFARPDLLGPVPVPTTNGPVSPTTVAPLDAEWKSKLLAALRSPGPAVHAEIHNLQQRFRLRNGLPTPVAVRLALSADADPEIHARIELASPEEAKQLLELLPGLVRDLSARLFWVGLGGLLSGLKFQGRAQAVEINGRFPRGDTLMAMTWLSELLPPPDRFLDPPPPPPPSPSASGPAAEPVPDMGLFPDGRF